LSLGDDELAALAAANDGAAFGNLVGRHQGVVRGFLRRLTKDEMVADDLAQESFLRAYQKIALYRGPDRLRSWLLSIAYREFLAYRRKQKRWSFLGIGGRDAYEVDSEEDAESGGMESPRLEDKVVDTMALNRAMDSLVSAEREAILLCEVHGFSHSEAAKLMGAPLGTVKSHVSRGRKRLQSLLAGGQ
jgi:RNA polymerase sigma-70 factor (ECF subfamily)